MLNIIRKYFTQDLMNSYEEVLQDLRDKINDKQSIISAKDQHIVDLQVRIDLLDQEKKELRELLYLKVGLINDNQTLTTAPEPIKGTTSWTGLRSKIEKRASAISLEEVEKSRQEVEDKIKQGLLPLVKG